ncbi:MAG: RES family NAD+ phosphorylase [Aphanocapsa lilacina HA4352-LM1]|nr:RES family NAD+ phosphorylase [Aphanocapsa lilacina HA4352-LM1]
MISSQELTLRSISKLICLRPLRLVDIIGAGLARIGADGRLCTGDHRLAQRWALALWRHPDDIDGICYRTRHDLSQLCAVIFDRSRSVLMVTKRRSVPAESLLELSPRSSTVINLVYYDHPLAQKSLLWQAIVSGP